MKKRNLKARLVFLYIGSFLVCILPLASFILANWNKYAQTPNDTIKICAGGVMAIVFLVLAVIGKLKMPSGIMTSAVLLIMAYLLQAILADLVLILSMYLIGQEAWNAIEVYRDLYPVIGGRDEYWDNAKRMFLGANYSTAPDNSQNGTQDNTQGSVGNVGGTDSADGTNSGANVEEKSYAGEVIRTDKGDYKLEKGKPGWLPRNEKIDNVLYHNNDFKQQLKTLTGSDNPYSGKVKDGTTLTVKSDSLGMNETNWRDFFGSLDNLGAWIPFYNIHTEFANWFDFEERTVTYYKGRWYYSTKQNSVDGGGGGAR